MSLPLLSLSESSPGHILRSILRVLLFCSGKRISPVEEGENDPHTDGDLSSIRDASNDQASKEERVNHFDFGGGEGLDFKPVPILRPSEDLRLYLVVSACSGTCKPFVSSANKKRAGSTHLATVCFIFPRLFKNPNF